MRTICSVLLSFVLSIASPLAAFASVDGATATAPTFDSLGGVFAVLAVVAVVALVVLGYSLHRRNKSEEGGVVNFDTENGSDETGE